MLEPLERRSLLSAVFYDPDSQSIKVFGTDGADQVRIVRRDTRVVVYLNDATARVFDYALVQWVEVLSYGGDDHVSAEYAPFRMGAFGGAGRDTLVGGWGDDILYGNADDDHLTGNAGNDIIDGEGGRDRIFGLAGRDTLDGGAGHDFVQGGDGDDYLEYYLGHDTIDGGAGADTVVRYNGSKKPTNMEGQTLYSWAANDDPHVHLGASIDASGVVSVVVTATHWMGGYTKTFGSPTRTGTYAFSAFVNGTDVTPPGSGRTAALDTDQHTYSLGRLGDGTYSFAAHSDTHQVAALTIQIVNGKLVDTPADHGPWGPTVASIVA